MARETKAARNARIGDMLAEYNRMSTEIRKLEKDLKTLKPQIRELAADTYGDWVLSYGTPRTIMDQPRARELLTSQGIDVPETITEPPIQVNPRSRM